MHFNQTVLFCHIPWLIGPFPIRCVISPSVVLLHNRGAHNTGGGGWGQGAGYCHDPCLSCFFCFLPILCFLFQPFLWLLLSFHYCLHQFALSLCSSCTTIPPCVWSELCKLYVLLCPAPDFLCTCLVLDHLPCITPLLDVELCLSHDHGSSVLCRSLACCWTLPAWQLLKSYSFTCGSVPDFWSHGPDTSLVQKLYLIENSLFITLLCVDF